MNPVDRELKAGQVRDAIALVLARMGQTAAADRVIFMPAGLLLRIVKARRIRGEWGPRSKPDNPLEREARAAGEQLLADLKATAAALEARHQARRTR